MLSQHTRAAVLKRLEEGKIYEKLREMEHSPQFYIRASTYSANIEHYPDGQIPFVDKHIAYLMDHPKVNPEHYLANLRLMLRKR